jgi:DNA replication and repair protein RecF
VRTLAIDHLAVRTLRNLERVDISFGAGFNVISGENGQGKTSLLEAIYLVATSKGFRSNRSSDLIAQGQSLASVRVSVVEGGLRREQSLGLQSGGRRLLVDGKKPQTAFMYAVSTPVVVFHSGEIALSMGGGVERRRLVDRISLYLAPESSSAVENYARAHRERQRALEVRGPNGRDVPEWEDLMVRYGLAVTSARADASRRLADGALRAYAKISAPSSSLDVRYSPGSPLEEGAFHSALVASRTPDARRGAASVGPHKDDLDLRLDARPVRGCASEGQHRAVVLSLKSAEVEIISFSRGVRPILLLDDVSSELDRFRTRALFAYLQRYEGQVFLSTTRPEIIELIGEERAPRRDFEVRAGVVSSVYDDAGPSSVPPLPLAEPRVKTPPLGSDGRLADES